MTASCWPSMRTILTWDTWRLGSGSRRVTEPLQWDSNDVIRTRFVCNKFIEKYKIT